VVLPQISRPLTLGLVPEHRTGIVHLRQYLQPGREHLPHCQELRTKRPNGRDPVGDAHLCGDVVGLRRLSNMARKSSSVWGSFLARRTEAILKWVTAFSRTSPSFLALERLQEIDPAQRVYESVKPGPGGSVRLVLTPLELRDRCAIAWRCRFRHRAGIGTLAMGCWHPMYRCARR
jgi:hypothetical protein